MEREMIGNLAKLAAALTRAAQTKKQGLFVERRIEPRLWCSDLVQVWHKDAGRWKRKGLAVLEDISPSGACLQMEVPLPNGSPVRIKHAEWKVEGEIRYCVYKEEGYFIGVLLENTKWTADSFRPKHLIDPTKVPPRKQAKKKSASN